MVRQKTHSSRAGRCGALAVGLAGLLPVVLVGACGSDDGDGAAARGDTATTTAGTTMSTPDGATTTGTDDPSAPTSDEGDEPVGSTDDRFPDGLRDVRYCEVLLLSQPDGDFQAEVWNTLGLNECPQADWDALDAGAIAEERGALLALLNGPRYWTLDTILSDIDQDTVTTFGALEMFRAATVDLGPELPAQTPYTERPVARETIFRFDAGTEVHELTAPDGQRYVMQAYSHFVDDTQTLGTLSGLGGRLDLPEGWTFSSRTLDERLDLLSTDGVATVLQDELQNTYQRDDSQGIR